MGQQALVAATSPSAYIGPMTGLPTMAHSAATQGINGLASTITVPTSGISNHIQLWLSLTNILTWTYFCDSI
jgi:hypothetical protein